MTTEAIRTMLAHRSVRSFSRQPLDEEVPALLKEAMRRAPTSSALQTYTVVFVQDEARKAALKPHAGDQDYIRECALFLVACADLRRVRALTEARDYPYRAHDLRGLIAATEDLAIAMQNASLAAQSLGLGTVMIGGVLNGSREIAVLLGLPSRVAPVLGLCVGHPAEEAREGDARPRLPTRVTFHDERYALSEAEEHAEFERYDREVIARAYYHGRRIPIGAIGGREDPIAEGEYGWTEHVARKQSRLWWLEAAPKLFADLRALGFDLAPPDAVDQKRS